MKCILASIHSTEHPSVSLNQSVWGVSCAKLGLLTTKTASPVSFPPLTPPMRSQDESVSGLSGFPRDALFHVSGSCQRQITLWRPTNSFWYLQPAGLGVTMTHSYSSDKKLHPQTGRHIHKLCRWQFFISFWTGKLLSSFLMPLVWKTNFLCIGMVAENWHLKS